MRIYRLQKNIIVTGGSFMKRSNGEGTIFKRSDGRWCGAYYDEEPLPKRHYVYGNTQKEVKKKLKERKNSGKLNRMGDENYSLQEWMKYYLENYKRNEIKETTYGAYQELYRKHIENSDIGRTRLERVTTNQLQQFYNNKTTEGYNAKSVRHIYVLINGSLEKAVQLQYVKINNNKLVVLPKKESYKAKILSTDEVKKILTEAKEEELYPIIVLTLFTGLRKGEVMALKWKNVNLEKRYLFVEGSLGRVIKETDSDGHVYHEYKILEPKTEKSRRIIPLSDIAIEALEIQKHKQNFMKKSNSLIYQDKDLVFARYDGDFINQRKFMDDYHKFLKKYQITDIRFHDLRHTFASILLETGQSMKMVQELLGHSTITTSMDLYAHVTKSAKNKAIESLNRMISTE